jgi:hypothetical protein
MMTMLWLGLPFGFFGSLAPVPARLPRSIEIEPLFALLPVVPDALDESGVEIEGAVMVGTLIDGAVMGVTAPAGPEPATIDAIVPRNPSASTAPTTKRRPDPFRVLGERVVTGPLTAR